LAFNHLLTHAFFKAGLFLCAGSVIYAIHKAKPKIDAQNMYLMSGLSKQLPFTFLTYIICGASMIGLPFFSGFVTKDAIIELWYEKSGFTSQIILISLFISTALSAIYMSRQAWLIFLRPSQAADNTIITEKKSSILLKIPLAILAFFSTMFILFLLKIDLFHINIIAISNTIFVLLGIIFVYFFKEKLIFQENYLSIFDRLYKKFIVENILILTNKISDFDSLIFDGATKLATYSSIQLATITNWADVNLVDGLVNVTAKISGKIGKNFTKIQSGQFQWYISAAIVLLLIVFWASF
jgi:NADH-quinone oxidoreductase subunit L